MSTRRSELAELAESSPFHPGELEVQDRAGVLEDADFLGRRMIRPYLTEQNRQFFSLLRYVFVGSMDESGQLWASMLLGAPGFVHSPSPHTLAVHARVAPGDPLERALRQGAALGMLGIQLDTRRRNRVNGHVRELRAPGFVLQVAQAFGNCPKYISVRAPVAEATPLRAAGALPRAETELLSERAASALASADTCFVASASAGDPGKDDTREGIDVSHRGGKPGFIRVEHSVAGTRLLIPDFPGNNAFNTLGNLTRYPRAGLLVPSFDTGDVLLLTCDAEVIWQGEERAIAMRVRSGWYFSAFMPFPWTAPKPGPGSQLVGSGAR